MEVIHLEFNKPLIIELAEGRAVITVFNTGVQDSVKLGIKAPQGLKVMREEVFVQQNHQTTNSNVISLRERES